MRILLIGYGKMGQAIEGIAVKRGHEIVDRIDVNNIDSLKKYNASNTDAAIEFSSPASAYNNVVYCIENNIPVVCGTTGWLEQKKKTDELCVAREGSFCYSSNFSIGVNLFWALNEKLAIYMEKVPEYDVTMEEIHHVYKKDTPSGTAITTAEGILKHVARKEKWSIDREALSMKDIYIDHKRIHNNPGTHTVLYTSSIDSIELTHTAFNREGFATGAVVAAEYIQKKKGLFNMKQVLDL